MIRIQVPVGPGGYEVLLGEDLVPQVAELAGLEPVVVSDATVWRLHGERIAGARPIIVPPGEESKSWAMLQHVAETLLSMNVERGGTIVALGGGVVGDLAGFAAAIVKRGCAFIQVPTTLLAQVDSSVGGKTGINSPHGKNLIGAFHQPKAVIADVALLDTLDPRHVRAGYAELVKYGLGLSPATGRRAFTASARRSARRRRSSHRMSGTWMGAAPSSISGIASAMLWRPRPAFQSA
jgi:3-dehydroquinate synthetase